MSQSSSKKVKAVSKYKVSRRLMTSIWESPKDAFSIRNTKPGQHGASSGFRSTDYGLHLKEKQKLKAHYGRTTEKQMKNAFEEASNKRGNTADNFISFLERRLYVIVYRLNIAPTIFAARQLVSHKHILVNGKVVNIASYLLKKNDIVAVHDRAKKFSLIQESMKNLSRVIPEYLNLDKKNQEGRLLTEEIQLSDVPFPFKLEMGLVMEFYAG